MNFYKLENKLADQSFLTGTVIQCNAVVSAIDYNMGILKPGDKIVVVLSNGRKYMGYIANLSLSSQDEKTFAGVLEIVKNKPSLPFSELKHQDGS